MLKKSIFKSSLLSSIVCLATTTTLINLSSCSQNVIVRNIELPNSTFTVNVHEFAIPVYFNFQPKDEVTVTLQNADPNISLKNEKITVKDGKSNLDFVINESITSLQTFNFDIQFQFKDEQTVERTFNIFNVLIYYTNEEIIERDAVLLQSHYVSSINSHLFKYICTFPVEPTSELIHVSLSNKSSNLFDLVEADCPIIQSGSVPYIEIQISLNMSVFQKSNYSFDMNLSFINSYSKSQTELFDNCTFLYDVDKNEEVPLDYLNLEPVDDEKYNLTGLKKDVSPLEGGKFKVLNIPKNVVSISENAFTDSEWFSNIRKILIPSTVKTIGRYAFAGCNNLTEFDFSSYGDKTPEWHNTKDLFNSQTFNTIGGFVWADKYPNFKSLHSEMLGWGLPDAWDGYTSDMYTSENDFTYEGDDNTVINGLNPDTQEKFKHYKVIRIPDKVTNINNDSFNYLKENPYESPQSTPENPIYETRELVVGEKLQNFNTNAFQNAGFSGNILLYCNEATQINENAFSNMHNYGWPGLLDVVSKPLQLVLANCSNVTEISNYAFNFVPFTNKVMTFKKTISTFGDFCFQGNCFEKLVFTDSITNVGRYCFANVFQTPITPHLNCIDLSCYDEIINPGDPVEDQTYIPDWMNGNDFAFNGSCVEQGDIYLSAEIVNELKTAGKYDAWVAEFKQKHKIPSDWEIVEENILL